MFGSYYGIDGFLLNNNNVGGVNLLSTRNTTGTGLYGEEPAIGALLGASNPQTPESAQERMTPLGFRKSLGLKGNPILTGSTIGKDGSNTDIYQFDDGTGEVRVKTSKDKNTTTYTYYKYEFSQKDPAGVFTERKITDESGAVGYYSSFIDYLNGIATN